MKRLLAAVLVSAGAATLTACPPAPGIQPLHPGGCYDSSVPGILDLYYDGPLDTTNNARLQIGSTDGDCLSMLPAFSPTSIVTAATKTAATGKCDALAPSNYDGVTQAPAAGFNLAGEYWICRALV